MPMPGEPVTNDRLETLFLGIATQIASGMAEVKSEMSALINEAKLRWQAKLDEQRSEAGTGGAHPDVAALRAELAQSQAAAEGTLRAQDAELKQLQQGLTDFDVQARRAEATTGEQLELRTETVLDTMTEHFGTVFDEVKAAVESLDWKLQGHANQVW